ncbi:MAG: glycosyltransferase family 39 protein [Anaerolineae bacterium]|nr:glycosyltransferase family 39 protein [Anaerolineae bacterium]
MSIRLERRVLLAIILLSVLLRVGLALALGDSIAETRGGTADQVSYDALGWRVATGHGFSFPTAWWPNLAADQPTAFWSFLYALYLAGIYALVGHHPLAARLVQAVVVGVAMPWLTWRIGRRIFGPRPALIAAGINAVYLYFVTYAASLMTEAFYMVGILWTLDASMRLAEAADLGAPRGRLWRLGVELGVAMGVTLLLRQVISAFLLALALWFLVLGRRRGWLRQALAPLAAAALVTALVLLPFVVRNYRVFGVVGMPNNNVGINFFWANHPIYGTRFEAVLSPKHGVSYQDLIPEELRGLSEPALDRALLVRGLQFVVEDPRRYALLSLSRVPIYFQFWPSPHSTLLSNVSRLLSFGLFLPFMLYGLVLAVVDARRQPVSDNLHFAYLLLLGLFMAVYALVHLLSWANVRYRLPVDAVWILFAGYALDDLWRRVTQARPSPSALPERNMP